MTAGDYDDLLNFSLYQDYISDYLQSLRAGSDVPYVDISSRIAIKVTDAAGDPLFGASVKINLADKRTIALKTPVNGVVNVYPVFDKLPKAFDVVVSTADMAETVTETVDLEQLKKGEGVDIAMAGMNAAPTQLDVALVLDTTGSMGDEIRYLQVELQQVFRDLQAEYSGLSIHSGLVAYRDIGDTYVHKEFPFTADLQQFELDLSSLSASGGGDMPEAMDQGLDAAMKLKWRKDSIKVLLLVADAQPHDDKVMQTWASAEASRTQQIHMVPVAASGIASKAEFIMRSMAALTNSRYIFLTNDSGVGGDHGEPSIDCYVVTRLDSAIRRVLASLISGERVEPTAEELIRTVGIYNNGVCEAPPAPEVVKDPKPAG